ncbi:hypothetical protein [Nannocystis pusilla]|uniref:hypothetical protein n=1 Tax=Nannocystis pusilla TaxID=889268 RepID=UPI003B7FFF60
MVCFHGTAHWLHPRGADPAAIARRDFLRPRFRGDRLLRDLGGARLGVDPAARQRLVDGLLALGYLVDRGGDVLTGAGFDLSLESRPGPTRLIALEFRLTRAADCDIVLGAARLRCAGDRAELRLERAAP